jgi:hypothetical protein
MNLMEEERSLFIQARDLPGVQQLVDEQPDALLGFRVLFCDKIVLY